VTVDPLRPLISLAVVRPDTSLPFYQSAVAIFAALILTGVVGEIRDLRTRLPEAGGSMTRALRLHLLGIVILLVLAVAGVLLSLSVLGDPPAQKSEQLAVSFLLAVTVVGIPLLVLGSLGDQGPKELKWLKWLPLAAVLVLLIGVPLYLLAPGSEKTSTYTYHVYGTCAVGRCGLNEHKNPWPKAEPLGQLRDGDEVEIVCQVSGRLGVAPNGASSRIWDKLSNGAYVNDVAVDTPPVGSGIPACE
jgi:hypothetical protein